jgi:hypothetical protein
LKQFLLKFFRAVKLVFGLYKKVEFNDRVRTQPVSRLFGFDRGMPIDRYYIEKFLSVHSHEIRGRILEIAEDTYARKFADLKSREISVFETLHFDGSGKPSTITGDLAIPASLPENRYDCFICTQTYNFIYDVKQAIAGTYQLLKNDGIVLATVAGISQVSRYDMDRWGDYWRFTDASALKLFEDVFGKGHVEMVTFGNVLAATALLQGLAVEDLPDRSLLDEKDPDYQVIIGIIARKLPELSMTEIG